MRSWLIETGAEIICQVFHCNTRTPAVSLPGPQSTYFPNVSAHSAGAYTATLLVMVNVMRGGGRASPTLTSQG